MLFKGIVIYQHWILLRGKMIPSLPLFFIFLFPLLLGCHSTIFFTSHVHQFYLVPIRNSFSLIFVLFPHCMCDLYFPPITLSCYLFKFLKFKISHWSIYLHQGHHLVCNFHILLSNTSHSPL